MTQPQVTDWGEVLGKLINAILVIVVVAFLANVLHWLDTLDATKYQNLASLYGALTTFAGTALGAYFGISVSGSAAKTAANAAADSSQKLGVATEQLATTQKQLATTQQQIVTANNLLGSLPPDAAAEPQRLDQLRTVLQQ